MRTGETEMKQVNQIATAGEMDLSGKKKRVKSWRKIMKSKKINEKKRKK